MTNVLYPSLTALTYNARLWGGTGMVNGEATRLYFEDHQRVEQIADRLRETGPDLIGLQELFCPEMQRHLIAKLSDQYPYHARSVTHDGVEQAIRTVRRLWPRFGDFFEQNIQKVVDGFTLSHYQRESWLTKGLKLFVSEDTVLRFLHNAAEKQFFWGAGLLFFSKYPILNEEFVQHHDRADLERFAEKGVLKIVVQPPGMNAVTVLLTHLQEGNTPHALTARKLQLCRIQDLMKQSCGNIVVMGDLNVSEGWLDEHQAMVARFLEVGGLDCFRTLYHDQKRSPGYTYRVGSPFEHKLLGKMPSFMGEDKRLDYIFSRGFQVLGSRVLEDEFSGLSDHSPVLVRFG